MEYFDVLKGLTETRSNGHEITFGDLLRECRESAKEKVNEREPELDTERPEKPRPEPREEEPDPDAPPEPPDEVKEPEKPMEMRKEYLGKSEDTHYYFITTEGGEGIIDDFVITDQEGVKKYSAKDQDIEVTEENIADFLIQAIRDVQIASIERSVFMKYIYPKLIEEEPEEEEEIIEEPEEGEEGEEEEKPSAPGTEEDYPRESKKITDSVDEKELWAPGDKEAKDVLKISETAGGHFEDDTGVTYSYVLDEEGDSFRIYQDSKTIAVGTYSGAGSITADIKNPEAMIDGLISAIIAIGGERTIESVSDWRKVTSKEELKKMAAKKEPDVKPEHEKENETKVDEAYKVGDRVGAGSELDVTGEGAVRDIVADGGLYIKWDSGTHFWVEPHEVFRLEDSDEKCNKKVKESYLIEMKVTDDEGNEFDVILMNSDEPTADDTAIEINGTEFRFSRDFVTMWLDEEGELSEEGLRELALNALANLEEDEFSELVAKGAEQEVSDEEVDDVEEPAPEEIEEPPKDEEGEEKEKTTDDVDMSKPGPIKPHLKYRPKQKEEVPQRMGSEESPVESKEVTEGNEDIEQELDVLDQMSISELRDVVGEEADKLPEKDDLIDAVMHKKFGDKYVKYCKRQVGLEKKNIEGDNEMIDEKTVASLKSAAEKLENDAKKLRQEAKDLEKKEKEAEAQKEGINPKDGDSEETKIKKLAEEEVKEDKIDETDVAKGAKALIKLTKDALHDADYAKVAEYASKLAEIEAVVPAEAEAEVKKDDKPAKDDKPENEDDDKPDEDTPPEEEVDELTDEKVDPDPVEEAKDKDDKKAKAKKAKKEKEDKAKKEKADKEAKAKKDKKEKEDKAKKAKKESKIQVKSTEDITETKSCERLKDLLGMVD